MIKEQRMIVYDFGKIKFVCTEKVVNTDESDRRLSRLESLTSHLLDEIESLKLDSARKKGSGIK